MRKKTIGNTAIEVSEIAFGGVEIGVPYGIGVKSEADMLSETDAIRLLHQALEEGINFFDTARLYGESEQIMGKAFENRRQEVVLATKCRHFKTQDGRIPVYAALNDIVRDSLAESLRTLRTDYVDMYMIHYADLDILSNDDVLRIFQKLREEGLVRAIGISVYKGEETAKALDMGGWNAIQLPFNLMDQSQRLHFARAAEQGVGLIVRSVLMRGFLSDRATGLHPALQTVEDHIRLYREFLGADFSGLPQLATQFALGHEAVSSVLVGIDKQQYLADAVRTVRGRPMDEALLTELHGMAYPDPAFLNLAEWDKNCWL